MIAHLETRAGVYSALAIGFEYPADDTDWELLAVSLQSSAARLDQNGGGLGPAIQNLTQAIDALPGSSILPREEYLFLFARQSPCPPYESAYHGTAMAHSIADVAGFYRAFGFQAAPASHELPDHLGAQLEFMAVLCAKQAYALSNALTEQAEICRDARRTFLNEHLGQWTAIFADRVRTQARMPLYPALTGLMRALLANEAESLGITLAELPAWVESIGESEKESPVECAT